MAKSVEKHIIILTESVRQSWMRDASTLALFVAMIGIGILLDSIVLQWTGAFVAFLVTVLRAGGAKRFMTVNEARAYLDGLTLDTEETKDG